jgi:hypothetical protein
LGYRNQSGAFKYSIKTWQFQRKLLNCQEGRLSRNQEKTILDILNYLFDIDQTVFQNQAEVTAHANQAGKGIGESVTKPECDGNIDALISGSVQFTSI